MLDLRRKRATLAKSPAQGLLAPGYSIKGGQTRGIISVSDPNSWNDVLSDAYAVVAVLGVGGYILAMLAL